MLKISMLKVGDSNVLARMAHGRVVLRKLLEATESEPSAAQPIFLDFAGIDAATSSFLREAVLGYRDATRMRQSKLYPVISNADEAVEEELIYLLSGRNEAMLACNISKTNKVSRVHLLGALDPKYQQTFDLVMGLGETDAGTLLRAQAEEEGVTRTAWNNRLATLSAMGLVIEVSHGRAKRYNPVVREN